MERFKEVLTASDEAVSIFRSLTDNVLRRPPYNLFIAESPKVIIRCLRAGYKPVSMLMERRHVEGDAAGIIAETPGVPVYTGSREVLSSLTGYALTRGVLCAFERRDLPSAEELCRDARLVGVLDDVCDTTNIGAIFRSAAAMGVDCLLLTRTTCDPLNRRSLRCSMGTVMQIPWTWIDHPIDTLRPLGIKTAALALTHDSIRLDDPVLAEEPRLALILGAEGPGLRRDVIERADYVVRIPMRPEVDSLNVAAASAVAFWQLRRNL